jgi:hypothetical protein
MSGRAESRYGRNRRRLRALLDSAPTNLFGREAHTKAPCLRERHLSPGPFDTCDVAVDAPCRAWDALTAERIRGPASYLEQVGA